MKIFLIGLLAAFIILNCAYAETDKWQVQKSTHFIVHYKNASPDFVGELIEKSEEYYDKIADDLGFVRFNFWLWDNRAHIWVYDDPKEYQSQTRQPEWSAGSAIPAYKSIYTYPLAKDFYVTVLPHEMGHIIFREFVGFNNRAVPLWLEEGVASYQMDFRRQVADIISERAVANNTYMTVEQMVNINPMTINDRERVDLYYAESVSIVNFLIKEFGRESFVLFCQNLRDKQDINRAIASAYPFGNTKELEQAWLEHLK